MSKAIDPPKESAQVFKLDPSKKRIKSCSIDDPREKRIKVSMHNLRWRLALKQRHGGGIDADQANLMKDIRELEKALLEEVGKNKSGRMVPTRIS